ncbi:MAG: CDP-archaeol synthase [Lachnospiraceae bacterium]|nr:CDP-archaeol synthase [Lachnospiraceae bacterium]
MAKTLIMMYVTLMPAIFAGILNMVWCRTGLLKAAMIPMDGGKCLADGRRIFGDNKTWKGFLGYVCLNIFCAPIWGGICLAAGIGPLNYFYADHANTLLFNLWIGLLLGLGYALFELPNSFLKRRLDIQPGKNMNGAWKIFFVFLDQADSIFGCALVVWLFYDLGIGGYLLYVLVGAATHIVLNMLLYFLHLRKNMF